MAEGWRVRFVEEGRDGKVLYEEGGETLSFYWAFGGGDVVASVTVGDATEWHTRYPNFAARREKIIARIGAEAIRQRTPTSRAALDEAGRFLNFVAAGAPAYGARELPAPQTGKAKASAMFWRLNEIRSRMAVILLVLTIVAGASLFAGRSLFTIKTTGTPAGASVRAGESVATPISRLEPYVPSLDRNHGRDRYSMGILIHSVRDANARRFVKVSEGNDGSDVAKSRIWGVAGDLVWFNAPEAFVVNVREARALSPAEAARAGEPPRPAGAEALTLLATSERRLESLLVPPGDEGAPAAPAGAGEIFNALYLRAAPNRKPLAIGGDFLVVYWTKRYREGFLAAARIGPSGDALWTTETPLGSLEEALPDPAFPALVGRRPRVEGKVAEPLLVVIDAETGALATHSLIVE